MTSFCVFKYSMSQRTWVERLLIWGCCFGGAANSPALSKFFVDALDKESFEAIEFFEKWKGFAKDENPTAICPDDPYMSRLFIVILALVSRIKAADADSESFREYVMNQLTSFGVESIESQVAEASNTLLTVARAVENSVAEFPKDFLLKFPSRDDTVVHPNLVMDVAAVTGSLLGTKRDLSAVEVDPATPRSKRTSAATVVTPHTGRREAGGEVILPITSSQGRASFKSFPSEIAARREGEEGSSDEHVVPVKYRKTKEFESEKEFDDYFARSFLLCDFTRKYSGTSGGFKSYTLRCGHKIEELQGFYSLHISHDSSKIICGWSGRCMVDDQGDLGKRFALYEPMFAADPRDAAMNIAEAKRDGDRVLLEKEKLFVTECGHTHTCDGRGCKRFGPLGLREAAVSLLTSARSKDALTNALSTRADFKHFKQFENKFQALGKDLVKTAAVEPEPTTPLEFFEQLKVLYNTRNMCVNLSPAEANEPMYICVPASELGGSAIIQTRKWAIELLLKSPAFYTDTTFGIFLNRPDKLLGVSVQDAFGTPFPIAFLVGSTEDRRHYGALFRGLAKAMRLVSGVPDNHPVVSKLKRIVMDGVNYGSKLVKESFPDAERTTCDFHMRNCVQKQGKTNIGVPAGALQLVLRLLHDAGRAPDAFGVVAVWRAGVDMVRALYPGQVQVEQLVVYVGKTYVNPLSKEDFCWSATYCGRKAEDDPHGPVAGLTTNAIESLWHVVKTRLDSVFGAPPATLKDLHMFLSDVFDSYALKHFRWTHNLLEDLDMMMLASRDMYWTRNSHQLLEVPMPDEENTVFLLLRKSRLLVSLDEAQAGLLMGEAVHEIGSHLQPGFDFEAVVGQINGQRLLLVLNFAHVVRFHKDHLPGTKDSFAYATCSCPDRKNCHHPLAIHMAMWHKRSRYHDPLIDSEEHQKYPGLPAFLEYWQLPFTTNPDDIQPPMTAPELAFNLIDIATHTTVEEWQQADVQSNICQIMKKHLPAKSSPVQTGKKLPAFDKTAWREMPKMDISTLQAIGIQVSKRLADVPAKGQKKLSVSEKKQQLKNLATSTYEEVMKVILSDVNIVRDVPVAANGRFDEFIGRTLDESSEQVASLAN